MRLGQLARKLAIRPTEIVGFLDENQIQIGDGFNTRLENEHVELIMHKFGGNLEDQVASEKHIEDIQEENSHTVQNEVFEIPDIVVQDVKLRDEESAQKMEVIKAPKIELSGLKVIGKIDLPEPKKTGIHPESENNPTTTPVEKSSRNLGRPNKQRNLKQRKNPIAIQREKDAEALRRKKEEIAVKEKEKRTQNYLKKVKVSQPTKPMRLVNEPVMEMSAAELEEAPRTWYGKLIRWFTKA